MTAQFDFQGALEAGYTEPEIMTHLSEKHPKFDVQGATESGYSPQEIIQYLSDKPEKERGVVDKAGRLATQFGLGLAESAALPYELASAPLATEEAQTAAYRGNLGEDIERLAEQKQTGIWDEQDQQLLDNLVDQMKDTSKSKEFIQTSDIGVRSLAEKATGLDLKPEGFLENVANITGFLKDPSKISKILKSGITPKEAIKAILPSGKETLRGTGIASGLAIAEDGGYGPIGTMAFMVLGDIASLGFGATLKAGKRLVTEPKRVIAEVIEKFTGKEKKALQQDLIKYFRSENIQADLGTITDNNLVKWMQARLTQSGLTGKALEEFKQGLFSQVKDSYKSLAEGLGEAKFATEYEAGRIAKDTIEGIRKKDLDAVREIYKEAESLISKKSFVNPLNVVGTIKKLEGALKPGKLKSQEQKKVLSVIKTLKKDVMTSPKKKEELTEFAKFVDPKRVTKAKPAQIKPAKVQDLINSKKALGDVINYEVQGGAKKLLKELVGDLDRAIISHGKDNPRFANAYIQANKRFSQHAKTFRNKDISRLLMEEDPSKLLGRMNTIQGIRNLEKILSKTPQGKEVFKQLKRHKLDQMFNNSFVNNAERQIRLGTFSNMLEHGKNKDIAKELLGKKAFARLKRIQNSAHILNESAQKFINTSQSASMATDAAIIGKFLVDIGQLLAGNPWPLAKTTAIFVGAKRMGELMADPEFLKIVEDVILETRKPKTNDLDLFKAVMKIKVYLKTPENDS